MARSPAEIEGVEFIKVHNALSQEAFFALADEVHKQGLPLCRALAQRDKSSRKVPTQALCAIRQERNLVCSHPHNYRGFFLGSDDASDLEAPSHPFEKHRTGSGNA